MPHNPEFVPGLTIYRSVEPGAAEDLQRKIRQLLQNVDGFSKKDIRKTLIAPGLLKATLVSSREMKRLYESLGIVPDVDDLTILKKEIASKLGSGAFQARSVPVLPTSVSENNKGSKLTLAIGLHKETDAERQRCINAIKGYYGVDVSERGVWASDADMAKVVIARADKAPQAEIVRYLGSFLHFAADRLPADIKLRSVCIDLKKER